MTAEIADQHLAPPHLGDIVMRGYFVTVDEGSALKRVVIGFGSGSAELQTVVEAYLVTAAGMSRLGSGMVDTTGGKGPGHDRSACRHGRDRQSDRPRRRAAP